MQSAILLVGHGSRDAEATGEFHRLVELFRQHAPEQMVSGGFLELARPNIAESIAECVERGAQQIIVLPTMLTAAGHTKNDIPNEINKARLLYPEVAFHYGQHLHLHARLVELCLLRLQEAESQARPFDHRDTLLLVVGRGSSDPDANAEVQKLTRLLEQGMGYGSSATAYIGMSEPLLSEALTRCQRMGFGRMVVFSFLLFTGVLEKRVRQMVADFIQEFPNTEVVYANYLSVHPLLVDVIRDRYHFTVK
jgi:sirohydrochlorin ferrochelatase